MTVTTQNASRAWVDLAVLCVIAIVSDLAYAGLTPLVVAYESRLHYDLVTSGWVATSEGIGFTAGALWVAVFGKSIGPTRGRVTGVLLVLAFAQWLSSVTTGAWPLASWRLLSGMAAGLTYATGMSSIASSPNPDRGFALYFGALFVAGLISLGLIPVLLQWAGLPGFYLTYAATVALCIVLVRWYPVPGAGERTPDPANPPSVQCDDPWGHRLLFAAFFLNFVFNGVVVALIPSWRVGWYGYWVLRSLLTQKSALVLLCHCNSCCQLNRFRRIPPRRATGGTPELRP